MKSKLFTMWVCAVLCASLCGCISAPKMQLKWDEPKSGATVSIYETNRITGAREKLVSRQTLPATFHLEPSRRYQAVVTLLEEFLSTINYQSADRPNPVLYGFLDVGGLTENTSLAKVPVVLMPEIQEIDAAIENEYDPEKRGELLDKREEAMKTCLLAKAIKQGVIIRTETKDEMQMVRMGGVARQVTPTLVTLKLGDQDPDITRRR